jgi:hypothetical protein
MVSVFGQCISQNECLYSGKRDHGEVPISSSPQTTYIDARSIRAKTINRKIAGSNVQMAN